MNNGYARGIDSTFLKSLDPNGRSKIDGSAGWKQCSGHYHFGPKMGPF